MRYHTSVLHPFHDEQRDGRPLQGCFLQVAIKGADPGSMVIWWVTVGVGGAPTSCDATSLRMLLLLLVLVLVVLIVLVVLWLVHAEGKRRGLAVVHIKVLHLLLLVLYSVRGSKYRCDSGVVVHLSHFRACVCVVPVLLVCRRAEK